MTLSFEQLRIANATRCLRWHKTGLNEWSLADWCVAVGGEVGEALNVVKKLNRDRDGQPGNTKSQGELFADLADELADIIVYLDILVASVGGAKLGVLWSRETFGDLRSATQAEFPDPGILDGSEWGTGLLEVAGKLATAAIAEPHDVDSAADELLHAVDALAWFWAIDLDEAVARKFNATSERYGFPERLAA